jgi:hypothetical protein
MKIRPTNQKPKKSYHTVSFSTPQLNYRSVYCYSCWESGRVRAQYIITDPPNHCEYCAGTGREPIPAEELEQ